VTKPLHSDIAHELFQQTPIASPSNYNVAGSFPGWLQGGG